MSKGNQGWQTNPFVPDILGEIKVAQDYIGMMQPLADRIESNKNTKHKLDNEREGGVTKDRLQGIQQEQINLTLDSEDAFKEVSKIDKNIQEPEQLGGAIQTQKDRIAQNKHQLIKLGVSEKELEAMLNPETKQRPQVQQAEEEHTYENLPKTKPRVSKTQQAEEHIYENLPSMPKQQPEQPQRQHPDPNVQYVQQNYRSAGRPVQQQPSKQAIEGAKSFMQDLFNRLPSNDRAHMQERLKAFQEKKVSVPDASERQSNPQKFAKDNLEYGSHCAKAWSMVATSENMWKKYFDEQAKSPAYANNPDAQRYFSGMSAAADQRYKEARHHEAVNEQISEQWRGQAESKGVVGQQTQQNVRDKQEPMYDTPNLKPQQAPGRGDKPATLQDGHTNPMYEAMQSESTYDRGSPVTARSTRMTNETYSSVGDYGEMNPRATASHTNPMYEAMHESTYDRDSQAPGRSSVMTNETYSSVGDYGEMNPVAKPVPGKSQAIYEELPESTYDRLDTAQVGVVKKQSTLLASASEPQYDHLVRPTIPQMTQKISESYESIKPANAPPPLPPRNPSMKQESEYALPRSQQPTDSLYHEPSVTQAVSRQDSRVSVEPKYSVAHKPKGDLPRADKVQVAHESNGIPAKPRSQVTSAHVSGKSETVKQRQVRSV
jgi:hypothetical protein